jgi:hypothetical protein
MINMTPPGRLGQPAEVPLVSLIWPVTMPRSSPALSSTSTAGYIAEAGILVNRSAAVVRHQSAKARLEQGSTDGPGWTPARWRWT